MSLGQQPEPLEASQIVLNLVKNSCCQYLGIFIYWILNRGLIFFTLTVLPMPLKSSSFQATDLLI